MRQTWNHGEKAELARRVGLREPYLNDLLAARRNPSPTLAKRIERHAFVMGLDLSRFDLLFPEDSENPLLTNGGRNDAR